MLNEAMFASMKGYVLKLEAYTGLRFSMVAVEMENSAGEVLIPSQTLRNFAVHALAVGPALSPQGFFWGLRADAPIYYYEAVLVGRFAATLTPIRSNIACGSRAAQGVHLDFESEVLPFNKAPNTMPELSFLLFEVID